MSQPTVDVGTGASLVFTTTSWTAEILDVQRSGIKKRQISTSHLGTVGGETFMTGDLYDPGEVTVKFHYNPDSPPPYTATGEIVQIKYPVNGTITTGSNDKVNMFVTELGSSIPFEDKMEGTVKLKCSGSFTHSAAA